MDVRSQYALRGYESARQSAGGKQGAVPKPGDAFSLGETKDASPTDTAKAAAADFVNTVMKGEETAKAAVAGKADALSMVEALAATELAMETAVTVRDKVVSAYQEILRMPV